MSGRTFVQDLFHHFFACLGEKRAINGCIPGVLRLAGL